MTPDVLTSKSDTVSFADLDCMETIFTVSTSGYNKKGEPIFTIRVRSEVQGLGEYDDNGFLVARYFREFDIPVEFEFNGPIIRIKS